MNSEPDSSDSEYHTAGSNESENESENDFTTFQDAQHQPDLDIGFGTQDSNNEYLDAEDGQEETYDEVEANANLDEEIPLAEVPYRLKNIHDEDDIDDSSELDEEEEEDDEGVEVKVEEEAITTSPRYSDTEGGTQAAPSRVRLNRQEEELARLRKDAKLVIQSFDDEFGSDLAQHLYMVYLLDTQNHFIKDKKFSAWPLPQNEVPIPMTGRVYIDELDPVKDELTVQREQHQSSKVRLGDIDNTRPFKEPPEDYMLELYRPQIDASKELGLEMDACLQRIVSEKIAAFNYENAVKADKKKEEAFETYEPIVKDPIALPMSIKNTITTRLNDLVDRLITHRIGDKDTPPNIMNMSDWTSVALEARDSKQRQRLEKLFSLKYPPKPPVYNALQPIRERRSIFNERRKLTIRKNLRQKRLEIAKKRAMLHKRKQFMYLNSTLFNYNHNRPYKVFTKPMYEEYFQKVINGEVKGHGINRRRRKATPKASKADKKTPSAGGK